MKIFLAYSVSHLRLYISISSYFPGKARADALLALESEERDPGQEDPLEEGMAIHSSILARRIPWRKEPGRLVHRVRERGW